MNIFGFMTASKRRSTARPPGLTTRYPHSMTIAAIVFPWPARSA